MQVIKQGIAISLANISQLVSEKKYYYLSIEPNKYDNLSFEILKGIYNRTTEDEKNLAAFYYWELSKKEGLGACSENFGRDCFWNDKRLAARSLHRSGLLKKYYDPMDKTLISIEYVIRSTTSESQYYSLGDKKGRDYEIGHMGFVNGMGNSLGWSGCDAQKISSSILEGNNLHCVYLPSLTPSPDGFSPVHSASAFAKEAIRHLSVTGGTLDRCACILAQLWIDYLLLNPNKYFLQFGASDGGTFIHSALKIVKLHCPSILPRLNLILLAPGTIILPDEESGLSNNQVVNFIKREDHLITKLGNGACYYTNGKHFNVIIVGHETLYDHPHNFISDDYMKVVYPYVQNFKKYGKLIN